MTEEIDDTYIYKEEVDDTIPIGMYINPNLPQEIPEQFTGEMEDKEDD